MKTRIYIVTDSTAPGTVPPRIVEAVSASSAVRHVASKYKAEPINAKELNALFKQGLLVEIAGDA